jgi:hypothetical protein
MVPKVRRSVPPFGFEAEMVDCDGYSLMMRAAYRALSDDDQWDDQELHEQIREDWHIDADGQEHMHRERFSDALFELVDMWTTQIDEAHYAAFLNDVGPRVEGIITEELATRSPRSLPTARTVPSHPPHTVHCSTTDRVALCALQVDAELSPAQPAPFRAPLGPAGQHAQAAALDEPWLGQPEPPVDHLAQAAPQRAGQRRGRRAASGRGEWRAARCASTAHTVHAVAAGAVHTSH